jgi:hypothetical protein
MIDFIIKKGTQKEHFIQAQNWNHLIVEKSSQFDFSKFQAQLCFKLANITEAKKWLKIALQFSNKESDDVLEIEDLRRQLNH